jgi:hypothetical protein
MYIVAIILDGFLFEKRFYYVTMPTFTAVNRNDYNIHHKECQNLTQFWDNFILWNFNLMFQKLLHHSNLIIQNYPTYDIDMQQMTHFTNKEKRKPTEKILHLQQ